jgi:serine/threonine-protein kinase HipA
MVATPGGLRLAPFYDLMCTRVHAGLGLHFAFAVAGEWEPGKISRHHIAALAEQLGVAPRYLQKLATDMAQQVERAIPAAAADVVPVLAPHERVLAQRLVQKITTLTGKMRNRIAHLP